MAPLSLTSRMLQLRSDVTGDDGAACQIFSLTTLVWVFATCGGREDWEGCEQRDENLDVGFKTSGIWPIHIPSSARPKISCGGAILNVLRFRTEGNDSQQVTEARVSSFDMWLTLFSVAPQQVVVEFDDGCVLINGAHPDGGFAHDYHWTAHALGMSHVAVWNDMVDSGFVDMLPKWYCADFVGFFMYKPEDPVANAVKPKAKEIGNFAGYWRQLRFRCAKT
ncbi:hypothetical protein IW261DRAFT_1425627 [Armillaria novae-zelandiae]|uniref:Uncharacterized protein n=1 Tax=Armillaria novae-zelandiae TaxID=153914 RepID=A0AA39U9X0_9AGAR|nr:hypothetical protein IW261DRAFT_1425627 [Armillaria novae-zelandiae]